MLTLQYIDIKGLFDNIKHDILIEMVRKHTVVLEVGE